MRQKRWFEQAEITDMEDVSDFEVPLQSKIEIPAELSEEEKRGFEKLLHGGILGTYKWEPPDKPNFFIVMSLPGEHYTKDVAIKDPRASQLMKLFKKMGILKEIDRTYYERYNQTRVIYSLFDTPNSLKESEEFADVSDYEEPPLRAETLAKNWGYHYNSAKGCSPQDAAQRVCTKYGCTIEDVCSALQDFYGDDGKYFANIIKAQSQKGNFYEAEEFEDVLGYEEPTRIAKVRVTHSDPDFWWRVGDILDVDVSYGRPKYPEEIYKDDEDEESKFNLKVSWLDPDTRYFYVPSTDDFISENDIEFSNHGIYQEQSMPKKRWFEANEVDPESGYIKEVPDEAEPEDEFGFSDVAEYEPGSREAALAIAAQPNYVDALEAFSTMYDRNRIDIIKLIPHGSGTFEAWWTGALDPKDYEPGQLPSPEKPITKEDIDNLASYGGVGDNGGEIFGLFMNSFYHSRMGWKMDPETLTYLVKRAMRYAALGGMDLEETFELEFPEIFGEMSEEDITETLKSPGIVARQVANAIRQRTTPER